MKTIEEIRQEIDKIDQELASLLCQRMEAVDKIGALKGEHQSDIFDSTRERAILTAIDNRGMPLQYTEAIHKIYQTIFETSRQLQQYNRFHNRHFHRIGIIGLGLIGGSICKALKSKNSSLQIGTVAWPEENQNLTIKEPWIDHRYPSLSEMISDVELIILASPISTIIPYARALLEAALSSDKKLVVIDVASVKGEIVESFEELSSEKIEFIGTHPMAGKEWCGFEHSEATLFAGKPWIVVPHSKNSSRNLQKVCSLINYCGGNPSCLDAKSHDQQTALISHLPYRIAKSYFDFVKNTNAESLAISGPGFASFSRIAHSNPAMHQEISNHNGKTIQRLFNQWIQKYINASCLTRYEGSGRI